MIIGDTKSACPTYNTSELMKWLDGFEWVYMVIAVILGLIECFAGCRIFKATLFLMGFLSGTLFVAFLLFSSWNDNSSSYRNWTILIFSLLVGVCVG